MMLSSESNYKVQNVQGSRGFGLFVLHNWMLGSREELSV